MKRNSVNFKRPKLVNSNAGFGVKRDEVHRELHDCKFESTLGKGVMGVVRTARYKGERYALKQYTSWECGVLQALKHPNIVRLIDWGRVKDKTYMVMELGKSNLHEAINGPRAAYWPMPYIKAYGYALLSALQYMHGKGYIHRDLKPQNVLVMADRTLRLADFGATGRDTPSREHTTCEVVTLTYRAPELLLGATKYGPAIDMWSFGAVYAELMLLKPLIQLKSAHEAEVECATQIWTMCGPPTSAALRGLPLYTKRAPHGTPRATLKLDLEARSRKIKEDDETIPMLRRLLCVDPERRVTADNCVTDKYWNNRYRNVKSL